MPCYAMPFRSAWKYSEFEPKPNHIRHRSRSVHRPHTTISVLRSLRSNATESARARTDNIAIFIISVSLMSRQRSKTTQCTRMIGGYKNWNNSEAQASDPNKFLRALDAIISIYVISVPTLAPAKQHSRAQTTNSRLSYHFLYSNKRHNSEIQSVFPKCRMHRQRAARNLLLFGKRLMYRSMRA